MGKTHRAELQNVCAHKLVFTSQRRCFWSCYYTLPASGTHRPHLGYSNAPLQMHLFQTKHYASQDKPIKKVLTDFQRDLRFQLGHPQPQAPWLKSLDPNLGSLPALQWERCSLGTCATNTCHRLICSLFPPYPWAFIRCPWSASPYSLWSAGTSCCSAMGHAPGDARLCLGSAGLKGFHLG